MIIEKGIYRGSFDPPHNGHLEAVLRSLESGMDSVTIIYTDLNPYKPFRGSNMERREMLNRMFEGMRQVFISELTSREVVQAFLSDPMVARVHLIAGSDLFSQPQKATNLHNKLGYFLIPRKDLPIPPSIATWNGLPVRICPPEQLVEQHHSSTQIRNYFWHRKLDDTTLPTSPAIVDYIRAIALYQPTDAEYNIRKLLDEAKRVIEHEIGLHKLVSMNKYPLSIRLGSDIGMSGLSGDVICFIMDQEKNPLFVVKIFHGDRFDGHYTSELAGLRIIGQLKLERVKVPEVLFSHKADGFALIGMSLAKGKSLATIMNESPEALQLCARACLELHMTERCAGMRVTDSQIEHFDDAITKVTARLGSISGHFNQVTVDRLYERWKEIKESFKSNPGYFSFTHGDPNPGNWIVDLDSKRVTYIDLSLFSRSISPEGTPYGFAFNEFTEAISSIRIVGEKIGLLPGCIKELQAQFEAEYNALAPNNIATPQAVLYFNSYWLLREINTLLKELEKERSLQDQTIESLLASKLEKFLGLGK